MGPRRIAYGDGRLCKFPRRVDILGGVNQWWDRWPVGTYSGTYDPETLNGLIDATFYMRDPYASVYDLDKCSIVQDIGTVF